MIVTHNMQQANRVSHYCAFFLAEENQPGRIVEHGPTKTMFEEPNRQKDRGLCQWPLRMIATLQRGAHMRRAEAEADAEAEAFTCESTSARRMRIAALVLGERRSAFRCTGTGDSGRRVPVIAGRPGRASPGSRSSSGSARPRRSTG